MEFYKFLNLVDATRRFGNSHIPTEFEEIVRHQLSYQSEKNKKSSMRKAILFLKKAFRPKRTF